MLLIMVLSFFIKPKAAGHDAQASEELNLLESEEGSDADSDPSDGDVPDRGTSGGDGQMRSPGASGDPSAPTDEHAITAERSPEENR
jgi:hypothetical protein